MFVVSQHENLETNCLMYHALLIGRRQSKIHLQQWPVLEIPIIKTEAIAKIMFFILFSFQ